MLFRKKCLIIHSMLCQYLSRVTIVYKTWNNVLNNCLNKTIQDFKQHCNFRTVIFFYMRHATKSLKQATKHGCTNKFSSEQDISRSITKLILFSTEHNVQLEKIISIRRLWQMKKVLDFFYFRTWKIVNLCS